MKTSLLAIALGAVSGALAAAVVVVIVVILTIGNVANDRASCLAGNPDAARCVLVWEPAR